MADRATDVVLVGPPTENDGFAVLREREDRLEIGEIRPLPEGKPIHGEVVRLIRRGDHQRLFDVEVLHAPPAAEARPRTMTGPAKVASDAYRHGWDAVFGPKPTDKPN